MTASTQAVTLHRTAVAPPTHRPQGHTSQTDAYLRVLNALILRDMRSRFGGSYWGYLLQMLWPVAHVIVIVSLMYWRNMPSPMGESPLLFIASGAFPVLAFKYMSREMMKGYGVHKALTWFPQVKRVDTMAARALVEICSSFMGLGVVCLFLVSFGIDPVPVDITQAMTGYLAAIGMGLGIGSFNVAMVSLLPAWNIIYIGFVILLYLTSGVMFMPCYMPEQIYSIMKWNPMVQVIEWVRLGYEPDLPVTIDYLYVLGWIFSAFTVAFLMDRYIVAR